jgi:hypothetical protein
VLRSTLLARMSDMSLQERASPTTRAQRRPASLACYQCRRKHLKCDGAMPVCARCTSTTTTCTYLPSRRGLSGRQEQHENGTVGARQHRPHPPPSPSSATSSALRETHGHMDLPSRADASLDTTGTAQAHASPLFSSAERSHLIGQYYSHFHRSHPMLVPRAHFHNQNYPDFLVVACCVVGHHFASYRPSEACIATAVSMAISTEETDIIFRIQAFILLALVFLGSHQMGRANDCLDRAALLAREARLDSFDTCNPRDSATTLERECGRRTFWELYTVDGLLALLEARPPKLATKSPRNLPFVPCADSSYEAGNLGLAQPTWADFERRLFLQDNVTFSSHFHRIEAANLVRRVCPLFMRNDADLQELEATSNEIASWLYNLPDSSFTSPESPEDSDQILMQAHLLVQVGGIFLHFPRSNLPSSGSAIDVTCLRKALPGMENSKQHAIKSIAASKELCHIASMPSLHESHSPLAICGFLLGCAVQLSAAALFNTPNLDQKQCRHRVVLMLGALRHIGKAWPGAQSASNHLKPFADAVFTAPSHCSLQNSRTAPDDVPQNMIGSSEAAIPNMTSEYVPEPMMNSALQENPLDINWFDFFQPDDTSGQLPLYSIT